ncbi:MAG: hypothetical protein GY757_13680 [bacterium]|nr:hypothetical protein [bacterium]
MTKFSKTLVFSDFHGDLDIMAKSFAAKGLMSYNGNLKKLLDSVRFHLEESFSPLLEEYMTRQEKPVRFLFLGDCLDRYTYGCHIMQFFQKIRWERFNIFPVFLLGNHDLLNLMFMANPFKIYQLHHGNGPSYSKTVDYLRSMKIDRSLEGFTALHGDELADLQKQFFRDGSISFSMGHYSISYSYDRDYSFFNDICLTPSEKEWEYINNLANVMGLEGERSEDEYSYSRRSIPIGSDVLYLMRKFHEKSGQQKHNWWDIMPGDPGGEEKLGRLHYGDLRTANVISRNVDKDTVEILPIDWRIMSMVWRKHYGKYFKQTKLLFHEDCTLFAHAGISPLSLTDSMLFGAFYFIFEDGFFEQDRWMSFDMLLGRANRVVSQVLTNAINDFSFEDTCGAEIVDQMGYWRGCHKGFPQFGGPLWCDFEYLQHILDWRKEKEAQMMLKLYKKFCDAYEIKRIICGHTPFYSYGKTGPRMKKLQPFVEEISLEYICIDNGCSRSYRSDKPVINGIEIDKRGFIL